MITKKLYTNCVNKISECLKYRDKLADVTNDGIDLFEMTPVSGLLIAFEHLLEYCTNDKEEVYGTNLSYYLYDLNSGEGYEEGSIIDEQGKAISLRNADDLWNNFIIEADPTVEDKDE